MPSKRLLNYLFTTFILLSIFTGCGDNSTQNINEDKNATAEDNSSQEDSSNNITSNDKNATLLKGVFYDSIVVGARYKTPTISGITDKDGIFKYKKGEEVEFFINNISLGKAMPQAVPDSLKSKVKADKIITPQTLSKNDFNKTIKIAQFLISLDSDKNASNGIDIDMEALKEAKNTSIDRVNLNEILNNIISEESAKEHLCKSLDFGCDTRENNNSESGTNTETMGVDNNDKNYSVYVPPISIPIPASHQNSENNATEESIENTIFNQLNLGIGGSSSFPFVDKRDEKSKIWVSLKSLLLEENLNNNSYYQNIKDFNPLSFKKVQNNIKKSKFFVLWVTENWEENWFDVSSIQILMNNGYIPVFSYWYFGDKLSLGMPDQTFQENYKQNNIKFASFLSQLNGQKIVLLEPEFNKKAITENEENQHKFASLLSTAIDIIKEKNPNILISLSMMDKGSRGVNQTYASCQYENCALGDNTSWSTPEVVYNDLINQLDFISFSQMIGAFSRDDSNPGDWNNPNPKSYTEDELGIDFLAERVLNFTTFLHEKYNKPIFIPYIAIATATWDDYNNNNQIENDEINKDGWTNKAESFYRKINTLKSKLKDNGLFGYAPMALFDNPRHDYGGYQYFINNEYHLGIVGSTAIDETDISPLGDLQFKSQLLEAIYNPTSNEENSTLLKGIFYDNIAHTFGKATQPPENGYKYYHKPSLAIDGNLSTFNHAQGVANLNWWQLEFPASTTIYKIIIHNRDTKKHRLNGAKVYISDENYTKVLPTNSIATLNSDLIQTINLSTPALGKYILIKANNDNHLHMAEVEVYGYISKVEPVITSSKLTTTIGRWHDKFTSIMKIEAVDYQDDILSYSISTSNIPFTIANNGKIYVNRRLNENSYDFNVTVSDGVNSVTKTIHVDVVDKMLSDEPLHLRSGTPNIWGYLPNTYSDGDELTVDINGVSYTPTIESNGTWSIEKDVISPPLSLGDYTLSLSVNSNAPIIYENYFTIYGKNIDSKSFDMSLSNSIIDVQISVTSSTSTPLPKGKVVRATEQNLTIEAGDTILYNNSYRTLHSLIATYTDNSNQKHFLRLLFNKDLKPYSRNVIDFSNEKNATIYHTAGQYNLQVSFGGVDCNQSTNESTIYCKPTTRLDTVYSDRAVQGYNLSEQQVFTRVVSTWNHLYNRVDGIKSIDAYIHKTTYKEMDYSEEYQSSDSYATGYKKDNFFYEKFFASLSPNNHTQYKTMRYQYAAEGMAGISNNYSTTGERNIGSWASSWEGSLRFQDNNGNIKFLSYETIEHESEHTHGMNHKSGLTYGWSHQARKNFIQKYYPQAETPSVKAPKYIFDSKVLDENNIKLTLYKTDDAPTSSNLTFEIFAGKMIRDEDISFEKLSENSVKITISDKVFPRFFIRVYGEDSDEFMSKFITPKEMVSDFSSKVGTLEDKRYYLFSRAVWEQYSNFTSYNLGQKKSSNICKILLSNTSARTAYLSDVDIIDNNITRGNLDKVMQQNDSNEYFGDNSNRNSRKSYIYDFTTHPYTKERYNNHRIQSNGKSSIDNAIIDTFPNAGLICVDE